MIPDLQAKLDHLIVRNAELEERIRIIGIEKHQQAFESIIAALEHNRLALTDLTRVVSPERIWAALIPSNHA